MFDVNQDGIVDELDLSDWVTTIKHTWFGDANLDGEFNSGDLVQVLAAGKYETVQITITITIAPAGPKATGTPTVSSLAPTLSSPSPTATMSRVHGAQRLLQCQSRRASHY